VMITGETGTGKELACRAVHNRSRRHSGPFVVFDCGAAADNLIESELFGHQRGAFTGAVEARPGVFEMAQHGTIFIDEIGELPLELQPKLLRVLEQREVRRIGASGTKPIDVRVVAATNRNLRDEVDAGRFREDLYYRLAVVEMAMPPLRNRLDDLGLLAQHLLERSPHNQAVQTISPAVIRAFEGHDWPGNVRELNNIIERALPFTDGTTIGLESLPETFVSAAPRPSKSTATSRHGAPPNPPNADPEPSVPFKHAKEQLIDDFERRYLVELLETHDGNVSKAARAAGMDRKTITRLMKKHCITR